MPFDGLGMADAHLPRDDQTDDAAKHWQPLATASAIKSFQSFLLVFFFYCCCFLSPQHVLFQGEFCPHSLHDSATIQPTTSRILNSRIPPKHPTNLHLIQNGLHNRSAHACQIGPHLRRQAQSQAYRGLSSLFQGQRDLVLAGDAICLRRP
jgi:hypothetical protein